MGSDGMGWDEMLTDTEMPMLTQLNSLQLRLADTPLPLSPSLLPILLHDRD